MLHTGNKKRKRYSARCLPAQCIHCDKTFVRAFHTKNKGARQKQNLFISNTTYVKSVSININRLTKLT